MFNTVTAQRPSLQVLNTLYEHDDFMSSIQNMVDLGCGNGEDLVWWATRTTRDDHAEPLNIRCVGVDMLEKLPVVRTYSNLTYQSTDFETTIYSPKNFFDILWCHNAFQYAIDPMNTLVKWRQIASPSAMLILSIPKTLEYHQNVKQCTLPSGVYYHYTLLNLLYILSTAGWDCRNGYYQNLPHDQWIRAAVYNSDQPARNPKNTTWFDLVDSKLLPESADRSIMAHGYLQESDLVLPWLDHSLSIFGK
jgi:SAM-dependent methyltransferase